MDFTAWLASAGFEVFFPAGASGVQFGDGFNNQLCHSLSILTQFFSHFCTPFFPSCGIELHIIPGMRFAVGFVAPVPRCLGAFGAIRLFAACACRDVSATTGLDISRVVCFFGIMFAFSHLSHLPFFT